MERRRSRLTGRARLAATLACMLMLLGLASCSRFKTMYLCARSCGDDTADGGLAGLVPGDGGTEAGDGGEAKTRKAVIPKDDKGRPEGALIRTRKLKVVRPVNDKFIKFIKDSDDRVYVFFYKPKQEVLVKSVLPDVLYNVNFRLRITCPDKVDECGDLVTLDVE